MKLVCESIEEAMIMTRDRVEDTEQRFAGNYVPKEYRDKFAQMITPHQRRQIAGQVLYKQSLLGIFKTPAELKKAHPEENDWVLRSADGNGELLLFNGEMVNKENSTELKMSYRISQDVNYFDARPIMYKHWKELDPQHQMASRKETD